jgi:hypothetical protein
MKANEIPVDKRKLQITKHEAYIEGPRFALGSGFIERTVIEANSVLTKKGWKPIEVVSTKEFTSLMTRTIIFVLSGEAYPVQFYLDKIEETINEFND